VRFTIDLGQGPYNREAHACYWPSWDESGNPDFLCTGKGTVTYNATLRGSLYVTNPPAPGKQA